MHAKNVITNLFGSRGSSGTCEVCGNEYDKCIEVRLGDETHIFDCFECAVHALAPRCSNCGCQIIGHGMETADAYFCCAHCASEFGIHEFEDRVDTETERSPV